MNKEELKIFLAYDSWMLDAAENPDWNNREWSHWTHHIPETLKNIWPILSLESRIVIIIMTNEKTYID